MEDYKYKNFSEYNKELLLFLVEKYQKELSIYGINTETYEEFELKYSIFFEICTKLNILLNINNEYDEHSISPDENDDIDDNSKDLSQEEIKELENYVKSIFQSNNNLMNNKKNFIEKSIIASSILKKYIVIEKEKNPDNYIDINKYFNDYNNIYKNLNSFENVEFWMSIFAKIFQNNSVEINITKKNDEKIKDIELAFIQSLISLGNYKKYELHFDFGKSTNKKILNDPKEKEKFLKEWKIILSKKLNIEENKFIFTNVHKGSVGIHIVFIDMTTEEEKKY